MKKFLVRALAIVSAIAVVGQLAACGGQKADDKGVVKVANQGEFMSPEAIEDFENETGIKVIYEEFPENEDIYGKIKAGSGDYDVIIPSDYMISKLMSENRLQKLDYSKLSNFKNIDEDLLNKEFDPDQEYSVPYMFGTLGIVYDKTKVTEEVKSWDILWDSKYSKEIYMTNSLRDIMAVGFKKLGYSLNSTNIDEINEVLEELKKQKPLVKAYVVDKITDKMINSDGIFGVTWSGEATNIINHNENMAYCVPEEGSNVFVDAMVISATAENLEQAYQFIDYMCKPEAAVKNADFTGYATANIEAQKLLPEEIFDNNVTYPTKEEKKRCETMKDIGDAVKEYDRVNTELKAYNP